jgi:site-specific recombinase XerD
MSKKHKMISSVIITIKNNKDGSYRTQDDRRHSLINVAETLHALGYKLDHLRFMKPKHIYALIKQWRANGDTPGSMKNRMSHLRWLMRKFDGKIHMVPSNDELGIPKRTYVTGQDKSAILNESDLNKIKDPLMRHSLTGQALFGLRMEESIKLEPCIADAGTFLYIQKSKGNRERTIPILTNEQREWLDEAKQLAGHKSNALIPFGTSYKTYRSRFDKACKRAGIDNRHGLRHRYAQLRYKKLTGWESPVKGGLTLKQMTKEQKWVDRAARLQISAELGHSRRNILKNYCD